MLLYYGRKPQFTKAWADLAWGSNPGPSGVRWLCATIRVATLQQWVQTKLLSKILPNECKTLPKQNSKYCLVFHPTKRVSPCQILNQTCPIWQHWSLRNPKSRFSPFEKCFTYIVMHQSKAALLGSFGLVEKYGDCFILLPKCVLQSAHPLSIIYCSKVHNCTVTFDNKFDFFSYLNKSVAPLGTVTRHFEILVVVCEHKKMILTCLDLILPAGMQKQFQSTSWCFEMTTQWK